MGPIAIALRPASLIGVHYCLGLRELCGRRNRLGQRRGDVLPQLVDGPQCHCDLIEVFQRLLRLPFALAVGATEQPDGRHQPRPVPARRALRRQGGTRHCAAVRATQLMQPMFIHQRFDLRQLDHLMPNRLGIVTRQGRPASAALHRTVLLHPAALFDRIALALMSLRTGLRAALPATRLALLAGRYTRSITRRRLRTVARRSPHLFPEPFILGAPAADFFFQHGQPLQHVQHHLLDTGRRMLPVFRSDLGIGTSQPCRFHGPETTKSGLAFHRVFSTPVNGYGPSSDSVHPKAGSV